MKKIFCLTLLLSCIFLSHANAQEYRDQKIFWENDTNTFVIMKGGKFGIINKDKEIIPVKYTIENFYGQVMMDGHCYFSDGAAFVLSLNGKKGVIDNHGIELIPFEYDYITILKNEDSGKMEFAGVEKDGKCAVADNTGKVLTGFDYDAFYGYFKKDGYASINSCIALKKGARIQFYDSKTMKVLDAMPNEPSGIESKIVSYRSSYGIISKTGEILLPCGFDAVYTANNAYFENRSQPVIVQKKKNFGFWAYETGFVLPVDYEALSADYCHGTLFFAAMFNKKYALMDDGGKKITEFEFDYIEIDTEKITGKKGEDFFTISPKGKITPMGK